MSVSALPRQPAALTATAVVDAHARYQIATCHSASTERLRRAAGDGELRLLSPMITLPVNSSMANCGDPDVCRRRTPTPSRRCASCSTLVPSRHCRRPRSPLCTARASYCYVWVEPASLSGRQRLV